MSLIKQLWLAIILMMAIAFGASFIINTVASKHYLEQQLGMKNQDNATSLALSISQMEKDPVAIDLMIAAQFDNGHYDLIKLTDPSNNIISKAVNSQVSSSVPSWFKKLAYIAPNPGVAQIQDGWQQYGTLYLASNTDFAYDDLWNGALSMLLWGAFIALLCGLVASFALKMIIRPLDEMVAMTEAIGDKDLISIKEPKTFEFRSLAKALNKLSKRINVMFKDQSQLLDQLRTEANNDATTGLMNRSAFSRRVSTIADDHDRFTKGVLAISHINNLAEVNTSLGTVGTDVVLKRMGAALQSFCDKQPLLIAGRLTGADFAIFSSKPVDRDHLCAQINACLSEAASLAADDVSKLTLNTTSSMINKSEQVSNLSNIVAMDNNTDIDVMALINPEGTSQAEEGDIEWGASLLAAIEAKRLSLASFPVINTQGERIHDESPTRLQVEANGPWLAAGQFIASATQLGLVSKLDLLALETAVQSLENDTSKEIGLNVSASAMCNPDYLSALSSLLKQRPFLASKLWLEVTEHSAFTHMSEFRAFSEIAKPLGCKVGVEHIGTEVVRLGELHDLHLDYIKIDASIIRDINLHPGNKAFLKGVCLIAHSIGLIAIAEGVQSEEELTTLPTLGVDAMTGPAITL